MVNWPWFSNVASDWLAALLAANQKLHLRIVFSYPCFYPRVTLVTLTPGSCYWNYYAGTLSCGQITANHLKIVPILKWVSETWFKATGVRSWTELQWLDLKIGHLDNSPSNGHQGDMVHSSGQYEAVSCLVVCSRYGDKGCVITLNTGGWITVTKLWARLLCMCRVVYCLWNVVVHLLVLHGY